MNTYLFLLFSLSFLLPLLVFLVSSKNLVSNSASSLFSSSFAAILFPLFSSLVCTVSYMEPSGEEKILKKIENFSVCDPINGVNVLVIQFLLFLFFLTFSCSSSSPSPSLLPHFLLLLFLLTFISSTSFSPPLSPLLPHLFFLFFLIFFSPSFSLLLLFFFTFSYSSSSPFPLLHLLLLFYFTFSFFSSSPSPPVLFFDSFFLKGCKAT